jgi:hypothetical protein
MSYTEDVVELIENQLSSFVSLPTFQLVTHVPNLAFWMREVSHAIAVLDGYQERFENMRHLASQEAIRYPNEATARELHEHKYNSLKPALTMERANGMRKRLEAKTQTLLRRLLRESLISIEMSDELMRIATEPPQSVRP